MTLLHDATVKTCVATPPAENSSGPEELTRVMFLRATERHPWNGVTELPIRRSSFSAAAAAKSTDKGRNEIASREFDCFTYYVVRQGKSRRRPNDNAF